MQIERTVLTPKEAAILAGVKPQTIYRLASTGRIRSVKVGRLVKIPREYLERFLAGTTVPKSH